MEPMDGSKLTPEQAKKIVAAIGPALGYVCRLAHRMQRIGWNASDPMYVEAWRSYNALHALHIHAHYASCTPGTAGRPCEPGPPAQAPPPFTDHKPSAPTPSAPWVGKRKGKRRQ